MIRSAPAPLVLGGALALGLLASTAVYQVDTGQQAVVSRLGRPLMAVSAPGLHLAWPVLDRVDHFARGEQTLQAPPRVIRAADGTELTVEPRMRYRVVDPVRFQARLGDDPDARVRLGALLADGTAAGLAHARADDIMADRDAAADSLALAEVRRRTAGLGVQVSAVELASAELPGDETEAIYARMRALAARDAADLRADGEQRRQAILADADRQVGAIRGDAEGEALRIRGEGEARRMAVLGEAESKDPAFARYLRQMQAYESALTQGDTTLALSPDNAFLHTFADGPSTDRSGQDR
jgi:modulator of FtsH protease HflC